MYHCQSKRIMWWAGFKRADWTLASDMHLDLLFMAGLQGGFVHYMELTCFLFAHNDCIYVLP